MKKQRSLAFKCTAIVVIAYVVSTILSSVFVDEKLKSKIKKDTEQNCYSLTESYAEAISAKIIQNCAQLTGYCISDEIKSNDINVISKFLTENRSMRPNDCEYVGYVNLEGTMVSDSGNMSNVYDTDYYRAIFWKRHREFASTSIVSKLNGRTTIFICKAPLVDGNVNGFVVSSVSAGIVQEAFENFNSYKGKAVLTCGEDFIASSDNRKDGYDILMSDYYLLSEDGYGKWVRMNDGQEYFISSFKVEASNWDLNFIVSKEEIMNLGKTITVMQVQTTIVNGLMIIALIVLIIGVSLRPLKRVSVSIDEIASGNADLSKRIILKGKHRDEVGRVVDGFNVFTAKLQSIIRSLKKSKENLSHSGNELVSSLDSTSNAISKIVANIDNVGHSIEFQTSSVEETTETINQISSNIGTLNKMVEEQVASVTQASTSVEEMLSNINFVNKAVFAMSNSFDKLNKTSSDGISKQNIVYELIKTVESESQILVQANMIISNIAYQTNLLAMNAAIEAAHAGESGKGFTVVADEIRKLSETSSVQTKSIGRQLKMITETISNVVSTSKDAQETLTTVFNEIVQTDRLVQEINGAMHEQEEGSKQIISALKHMNISTTNVSNASIEMSEGTSRIIDEVNALKFTSQTMKEAMDEMYSNAKLIDTTGRNLSTLSEKVSGSIEEIGTQVDQFKI